MNNEIPRSGIPTGGSVREGTAGVGGFGNQDGTNFSAAAVPPSQSNPNHQPMGAAAATNNFDYASVD